MKNYVLTFVLALLVVLSSVGLRRSVAAIGGSPAPLPPDYSIGGSPAPLPPDYSIGGSPAPLPPDHSIGGSPAPLPPDFRK